MFRAHIHRAHRAVIFAIAQLSCFKYCILYEDWFFKAFLVTVKGFTCDSVELVLFIFNSGISVMV